ncbi:FHA domain-containing protein [Hyalangium minutum]|uniref:FHA domain-containing protein n=1 Tax=Hyalangium minutum TaxID=394096 RepID=UPI00094AE71F|nr:FHA domain-containing protein [Hyalangium minutum]
MSGIRVRVGTIGGARSIERAFQRHEIVIGRAAENDVILKQNNVSKEHCRVLFAGGKLMVGDSGSTNGTYVNGKRVTAWTPLRPSDEVWIGKYVLVFSVDAEPEQAARGGRSARGDKEREGTRQSRSGNKKTGNEKKGKASTASADDEKERRKVRTPWDVLGVPKGTPKAEAKKAYHKLLLMYHPDKVDSLGPRLKELAVEITRELNEAWARIESGKG